MPSNSRSTLQYVAFIVFIDMAGVGLATPGMPRLIQQLVATDVGGAARIGGYLFVSFALMQFLFAPLIGSLSDRFGRRPVLLATLASFAVDYAVMAVAPSLAWLAASRMLSGITGATWAAANSCVADVIPSRERGHAFGVIGAAGAAGLVLGPAIGGMAAVWDVRLPFLVAASLAGVGVVVGLFTFAETLPRAARRPFRLGRANPVGSLLVLRRNPFVMRALLVLFLCQLALQAQIALWPYYGVAAFGWTPLTTGLTVAFYGTLMVVVRAVLTRTAIDRFGARATARYGIMFAIPSYLMLGSAAGTAVVLAAIVIGSMSGMTYPSVQMMMTAHVDADAQGELQGLVASSNALTAILGPIPLTWLFDRVVAPRGVHLPGVPFLVAAMLVAVAAIILWRLPEAVPDTKPSS